MSTKLSSYVWDGCAASGMKLSSVAIMARLADFSSDEGVCWPSIETIARQLGAGPSTVRTAIAKLEKDGWLSRTQRRQGNRNASNIYQLNVAKLQAAALSHLSDSDTSKSDASKSDPSKFEASESGKKGGFDPSESGGDPSVNSTNDPSDKKPSCPVAAQSDPAVVITDQAKQVLSHLNKTTGSRYQVCKSSLENIRARLADGFTPEELVLVVDYSVEKWSEDLKMSEYLRPTTLFQPSKFPGYLQSANKWDAAGRPDRAEWSNRKRDAVFSNPSETGVDTRARDAAYQRYFGLTSNNHSLSELESQVRALADRNGLATKDAQNGFAEFEWNQLWAMVARRQEGKAA